jgi:serine/threonine-protein kinase
VENGNSVPSPPVPLRAAEIREELDRILADFALSGAHRRRRLLRFLVEKTLDDPSEPLKESVIATEVFDREPGYDPQIDSVVRVEIGRLRARLSEYYEKPGANAPVRIEIPRGTYRPTFIFREAEVVQLSPSAPPVNKQSFWKPALAAVLALAAIVVAIAVWWGRASPPAAIAVLPFLNLSGDPADNYLADGVSEELTETLAESSDLRVVARTSAFQYKGKNVDVGEIGRNLRASAILEGSVARRDGQLRVIAQLIRSSDGYHLWSHSYDASLADLPQVEQQIARASREKLTPALHQNAPEITVARNPEAHDLYMRAVYEFNQRTVASTRNAIDLARQSAEKDSSFPQPYVLMAAGESQLTQFQAESPRLAADRAWQDIDRALAIDPSNSGAHAQKALLAYTDQWDWPQAEKEFKLALAAGSHGSAENLYGWCLTTRGRFEEARKRLQMAAELDPLSLGPQLNQVEELFVERKYPEAKRKVEQILRTAPSNGVALGLHVSIAFLQHDCPGARAAGAKLLDLYPKAPSARLSAFAADYVCGQREQAGAEASELFQRLPTPWPNRMPSPPTPTALSPTSSNPPASVSRRCSCSATIPCSTPSAPTPGSSS